MSDLITNLIENKSKCVASRHGIIMNVLKKTKASTIAAGTF